MEELQRLTSGSGGLAFIKGKWVVVNNERLREVLATYEQTQKGELTMMKAMRTRLSASGILNVKEDSCEIEISNGEWLETVVSD